MDLPDLVLPENYKFTPLGALRVATCRKLAELLDPEGVLVLVNNKGQEIDFVNDYSGLAELAGFYAKDIRNMKRQRSPSTELLDLWIEKNGTVGKLWMYLFMLERFDVLTDCRQSIVQNCFIYEEQQQQKQQQRQQQKHPQQQQQNQQQRQQEKQQQHQQEKQQQQRRQHPVKGGKICSFGQQYTGFTSVDETELITLDDVKTGHITYYDAFICCAMEDDISRKFLFKSIDELEVKRGLKLFVPGRDDLPGSSEHTLTAYVIEKRCRRVVVLLTKKFLRSDVCDFQLKFSHALSPGARERKLLPAVCEKNTPIPNILNFFTKCDFTKPDMIDWEWERLNRSITQRSIFEKENIPNTFDESLSNTSDKSLKALKFPSCHRLYEHEELLSHIVYV